MSLAELMITPDNIFENRLLVFFEDQENGVFHPVFLDEKQFKKVSDAIIVSTKKDKTLRDGYELVNIDINTDVSIPCDMFIGLDSITDKTDFEYE